MKHSSVELNFSLSFGAHFSHLLVEVVSTTVVIYCLIRSKNLVKKSFINGINQTLVGITEYGLCVYVSGFVRLISWVFDASTNGRTIIISSIEASNRQQSSFFYYLFKPLISIQYCEGNRQESILNDDRVRWLTWQVSIVSNFETNQTKWRLWEGGGRWFSHDIWSNRFFIFKFHILRWSSLWLTLTNLHYCSKKFSSE